MVLGENAIRFDVNKATLTSQAQTNLNNLVPVFNEYNDTDIQINGYTDSSGSVEHNLKLSDARAKSVADYLKTVDADLKVTEFKRVALG